MSPYIHPEQREFYEAYEKVPVPEDAGSLNFVLSRIIDKYTVYHGLNYRVATEVRGALYGALHEYDRLVVDRYEDKKMADNGPVFQEVV